MKKKIIVLFLIVLFSISGCVGLKHLGDGAGEDSGEEILVARDAVYPRPIWCARGKVLVYMEDWSSIFFYDIRTGQKEEIAESSIMPLVCTPDGERLIYLDSDGAGWEDGSIEHGTLGAWIYEFKTKRRQQLAIIYTADVLPYSESILSPDGQKILLGRRPRASVEAPETAPEIIWSRNERTPSSTLWLADSSAVAKSYWDPELGRDIIEVLTLTPEKKTLKIDPRSTEIRLWQLNRQEMVYMKVWDAKTTEPSKVLRCALDLKNESASCETVLMRPGQIIDFDILPDGETMVFSEVGGRCVQSFRRGSTKATCITPPKNHFVHNFSVSPDGEWIAYIANNERSYRSHESALYVHKIPDE